MMTRDVHHRRLRWVYCPLSLDGMKEEFIEGYEYIGIYEKKYGIPADVDAVWRDREQYMDSVNGR